MALTPEETKNMILLQRQVAWQYQLDLFTERELRRIQGSVGVAKEDILRHFRNKADDIGAWTKERLEDILNEMDAMTIGLRGELENDISELYSAAGQNAIAAQNNILSFGGQLPNMSFISLSPAQLKAMAGEVMVGGQLLNYWVEREFDNVMISQLRKQVLSGLLQGESYPQFLKRLESQFNRFSRIELTTLVRTYVQDANVRAQNAVYEANPDVVGRVEWSAVMEPGFISTGRGTCPRCAALDGNIYDIGTAPIIPLHPRCRCILLPVTKTYRELGLDIDEISKGYRPYTIRNNKNVDTGGKRKILEVGFHKGSYETWFNKRPKSFQKNVVGPGRLKLIDSGQVKFKQIVSPDTGRLYTIEELKKFSKTGFPVGKKKAVRTPKPEKDALKKLLVEKGPYPDKESLSPLTGREVQMIASGLNLKTQGLTRVKLTNKIVDYYKRNVTKPPINPPPGPIIPTPTAIPVSIDMLNKMTWNELRKFAKVNGVTGIHKRPQLTNLVLKKIGAKPAPGPNIKPKPVPVPEKKVVSKIPKPKKPPKPSDPAEALVQQQAEFDQFFATNSDFRKYKKWSRIQDSFGLAKTSPALAEMAPAMAQHQRLLESKVNWMRWLKETDPDQWEAERRKLIKQRTFFPNNANAENIPEQFQKTYINELFNGTKNIDDGLFLELDRGGLKFYWEQNIDPEDVQRAFYASNKNRIVLYDHNNFEIVGHEYGHAMDRWFSGQSSELGTQAGQKWKNNMFVSADDSKNYRKFYDKNQTGGKGTYKNGDGKFWKGNWINDYEGRIYQRVDAVGEQFFAMGSQRYTVYQKELEKLAGASKKDVLEDVSSTLDILKKTLEAKAYKGTFQKNLITNRIKVYENKLKDLKRPGTDLTQKDLEFFAAGKTPWETQRLYYPEWAKMQERIYKTEWKLKNDPLWATIEEEEQKWLRLQSTETIEIDE